MKETYERADGEDKKNSKEWSDLLVEKLKRFRVGK